MPKGTAHNTDLIGQPRDSSGRVVTGLHWFRLEDEHDHVVGYKAIRDGVASYYDISFVPIRWDEALPVPASGKPIPYVGAYAIRRPPAFMEGV